MNCSMSATPDVMQSAALPRRAYQVLIVDDQEYLCDYLFDLLDLLGYTVRCVSNGKEALEVLEHDPLPRLILLDLNMPVMNGWEFRRRQLQEKRLSHIPVALMSGIATEEIVEELQAVALLKKPIDNGSLLQTLEQYCTDQALLQAS